MRLKSCVRWKKAKSYIYGNIVCAAVPVVLMVAAIFWNFENLEEILVRIAGLVIGVGLFAGFYFGIKYIRRYQLYISAALVALCVVVALTNCRALISAVPTLLILAMVLFLAWNHRWNGIQEKKKGFFLLIGSYVVIFAVTVMIYSPTATIAVSVSFFTLERLAFKRFYIGNINIGGDAKGDVDRWYYNLFLVVLSLWVIVHFYAEDILDWFYQPSVSGFSIVVLVLQVFFFAAAIQGTRKKCGLAYYISIAAIILLTVEMFSGVLSSWGLYSSEEVACPFFTRSLSLNIPSWFLLCFILYPQRKLPEEEPAFETCSPEVQKEFLRYEEPEHMSMAGINIIGTEEREKAIFKLIAEHLDDQNKESARQYSDKIYEQFSGEEDIYCLELMGTFAGVMFFLEDHMILPVGEKVCGIYIHKGELSEHEVKLLTEAFGHGLEKDENKENLHSLSTGAYLDELYTALFFFTEGYSRSFRWINLEE